MGWKATSYLEVDRKVNNVIAHSEYGDEQYPDVQSSKVFQVWGFEMVELDVVNGE